MNGFACVNTVEWEKNSTESEDFEWEAIKKWVKAKPRPRRWTTVHVGSATSNLCPKKQRQHTLNFFKFDKFNKGWAVMTSFKMTWD